MLSILHTAVGTWTLFLYTVRVDKTAISSQSDMYKCVYSQLPRLYNIYKEMGILDSFESILYNVFKPLFEVTVDPASHPQLHVFLKFVWIYLSLSLSLVLLLDM